MRTKIVAAFCTADAPVNIAFPSEITKGLIQKSSCLIQKSSFLMHNSSFLNENIIIVNENSSYIIS